MMRLLFAKLLPLGLTGAFLQSSVSPIKPALNAFMAANAALAGQSTSDSGADFEAMLKDQLDKNGHPGAPAPKPPASNAKDQLNDIIAQVKGDTGDKGSIPAAVAKASKSSPHSPGKRPEAPPKGPETSLTTISGGK